MVPRHGGAKSHASDALFDAGRRATQPRQLPQGIARTTLAFRSVQPYVCIMRAIVVASGLWLSAVACTPSAGGAIDPRPAATTSVEIGVLASAAPSIATPSAYATVPIGSPQSSRGAPGQDGSAPSHEMSDDELMAVMLGESRGGASGPGGAGVGATVAAAPSTTTALARPPIVRELREFHSSAGLDPDVIRRVIRQQFGLFRACYAMGLAKQPQLAGTLGFDFKIDSQGATSAITRGPITLSDSQVVECVASRFSHLKFPLSKFAVSSVHFALEFLPGEPARHLSAP